MTSAKVSIIVITFNSAGTVRSAIKSILEQTYKEYEIIVLDNGSQDSTLEIVKELLDTWHGDAKIIASNRNLGFAQGNNAALEDAVGKYVALINPDAFAKNNWLEELVAEMEASPEVGICASKIIDSDLKVIDSAGDGFAMSLQGFQRGEGLSPETFSSKEYIFGACACAALYRRTMLDEIRFFDPDFFLIHEDTDLNFRSQLAGWKVLYVPSAIAYHKVRSSIGLMSDIAIYYSIRNKELVIIKNATLRLIIICFPQIIIGTIVEFIYFIVKHRKYRPYFKAKIDALRSIPKTLRKRSYVMKLKKIHNHYLLSLLAPIWKHDYLSQKTKKLLHG